MNAKVGLFTLQIYLTVLYKSCIYIALLAEQLEGLSLSASCRFAMQNLRQLFNPPLCGMSLSEKFFYIKVNLCTYPGLLLTI